MKNIISLNMNLINFSYSLLKLTAATKAKLEALGIDTTNIKTEAEGQAILKAAETNPQEGVRKFLAPEKGPDENIKTETQLNSSLNALAFYNKIYQKKY